MATTIKSTQLDFDTIKTKLKDFLKQKAEFADYDFEASGLSNILDVLAYNTHFNGLIGNFALNESFLNTAQLRSSIVSHAEALGYVPRSYSAAQAKLNLSLSVASSTRPTAITLPRNTQFTTSVDDVSYTFQTRENFTALDDGVGLYQFLDGNGQTGIPVFEGQEKTKTFFVGETGDSQIYVIPDITMDTTTIRVRVFATASSTAFDTYTNINKAIRITNTSTLFQIKEVPNGYFEVIFGDGISTGKAPEAGNKIVIDYLSTKATAANGASLFSPTTTVTVDGTPINLTTVTESNASGGAFKESIESIRQNAPISFTAQRRLVTAEDYTAQILANYGSFLDDVTSFGGADNEPPQFGKVFVGLKFKSNIADDTQQNVKDTIRTELTDNLAIMSIDTIFVDPITTNVQINTTFNLDPDLTSSTSKTVENLVQTTINNFFATNLNKFNKVFRRSNLLTQLDALDEAILNSKMDVKLNQTFTPSVGETLQYTVSFPVAIATPDDVNHTLTTSRFTLNGQTCTIKNLLKSTKLQVFNNDGEVVVDNIGSYIGATGTVTFTGFNPSAFEGSGIRVDITPANQNTIRPLRNYILDIDRTLSTSKAQLDFQNTQVTL